MKCYGYAGKILYVDLSTGNIKKEPLDLNLGRKFLGGWGINYRLMYDLLSPGTDPLSSENVIVLGTGPLVGTLAHQASKMTVTTKVANPCSRDEERYAVSSGVGGTKRFGAMLKNAGYDHLVITGRASKPSYLKIDDDDVEICDASDLWGKKDIYETSDELMDRHRGPTGKCGVWAIGRSGENLVRSATIFVDKRRTLGRNCGAVLGSKNLKGVVALGTRGVNIADKKKFMQLVNEVHREIITHPNFNGPAHPDGGGVISNDYPEEMYYETASRGGAGCMACLVACKTIHTIRDGRFAGDALQSHDFGTARDYGRRLRLKDYREMLKLMDLINRAGLDLLTTLKMIYFVTRLYERGIITSRETGGLVLKRGDFVGYAKLTEKMVNREDIGYAMAEGWYPLSKEVGVDAASDFRDGTSITKGCDTVLDARFTGLCIQEIEFVMRPKPQMGDTFAFYPRGKPDDRSSWPWQMRSFYDIKQQAVKRLGATKEEVERIFSLTDFNTARMTKLAEDTYFVLNALGVCGTGCNVWEPMHDLSRLSAFYTAATGFEADPQELRKAGERIHTMEKLLNIREGFTRKDDEFPALWVQNIKTPVKFSWGEGYLRDWFGRRLSEQDLEEARNDYYDERGWDIKKGMPTREKLEELGLGEFADVLNSNCDLNET